MDDPKAFRPSVYIAPSFSWASRIGPISSHNYTPIELVDYLRVLGGNLEVEGINPYGIVSGGYLKVEGILLPSRIVRDNTRGNDGLSPSRRTKIEICTAGHPALSFGEVDKSQIESLQLHMDAEGDPPTDISFWSTNCVVIAKRCSLVLVKEQDGSYRRIGLGNFVIDTLD